MVFKFINKIKKIFIINLFIILLLLPAGCAKSADIPNVTDLTDITITDTPNILEADTVDNNTSKTTTESSEILSIPDSSDSSDIEYIEETADSSGGGGIKDGFIFAYKDTTIYLGEYMELILVKLGNTIDYYEMPSCSFEGMAKIYYYNGFELANYLKDKTDKDRVYSITLNDDSVTTAEGIYIGQTFDDMIAAYGAGYEEIEGFADVYRYLKNGTVLSFTVENNIITLISYTVEDMYA